MQILVEAFEDMPSKKLIVIGDGPQLRMLQKIAPPNVLLLGDVPEDEAIQYIQRAKAFIYAAEEDFGSSIVEAQSCGTPIITYGRGGALETVRALGHADNPTGLFFEEQTSAAIINAVKQFEEVQNIFEPVQIHEYAQSFSNERFRQNILAYLQERVGILDPVDIFPTHIVKEGSIK